MGEYVNGGLLRIARQRIGLAQGEAAVRLIVPQVTLSRYENAVAVPTDDFIARASEVYDMPISFFRQTDTVFGAPVSVHPMWRKKADVTVREIDKIIAEINVRVMHLCRMLEAVEYAPQSNVPRLDPDDYNGDIERIAALVRAHWLLPPGPIENLTAAVERAGVIVVHSTMGGSSVSGVTVVVPGLLPVIVLNLDQPADRLRFTLAHELGHLVMHKFPSPTMEKEANEFASALLMPKSRSPQPFVSVDWIWRGSRHSSRNGAFQCKRFSIEPNRLALSNKKERLGFGGSSRWIVSNCGSRQVSTLLLKFRASSAEWSGCIWIRLDIRQPIWRRSSMRTTIC